MYIGSLIALIISLIISTIYHYNYSKLDLLFDQVLILYNIAIIVECFGEVFLVSNLLKLEYKISASAEASAGFIKTVILYFYVANDGEGLLGFGFG